MGRLYTRRVEELRAKELRRVVALGGALVLLVLLTVLPGQALLQDARRSGHTSGQDSGRDPIIAAAGDIACGSSVSTPFQCHQRATSDLLVGHTFDAVIDLGDGQYRTGALSAYERYFGPTWGRVKKLTHPVPGNHDYDSGAASGYYRYFGSAAGDPSKGYYDFNIGTWHVIALNSNCLNISGCQPGSAEERWLRQELASSHARCTLAFWHHPRFSSGIIHGSNVAVSPLWRALYDYRADLVLSGHEHSYERFGPQTADGRLDPVNGIREFVVGTGGVDHYPFGPPISNSETRNDTTFGVLQLTLHPAGYDWRFLPEAGAAFTDSGSAACH
jgi:hypothetical protein